MNQVKAYVERTDDNDASAALIKDIRVYPGLIQVFFKDGSIRNYSATIHLSAPNGEGPRTMIHLQGLDVTSF